MMKVVSYNNGSASAKVLSAALGAKRIRHTGRQINLSRHLVICWGNTKKVFQSRRILASTILNGDVSLAVDKLKTYKALRESGINVPDFYKAASELPPVTRPTQFFARTTLTGNSGGGIIPFKLGQDDVPTDGVKVYTRYIPKAQEYRVHVFNGEVIRVQRKARRRDVPDDQVNWQVRNLEGGFIFATEGVDVPDIAKDMCIQSIRALNLDFGAVDIIYNRKTDTYYILEVNTSPGLVGSTLEAYKDAIEAYARSAGVS